MVTNVIAFGDITVNNPVKTFEIGKRVFLFSRY